MRTNIILSTALMAVLAACGGAAKTTGGSGLGKGTGVPPPPPAGATAAGETEPKRTISEDAKGDYSEASQAFAAADKGPWTESTCRQVSDKFVAVARTHTTLVEAQYMAGLSLQRCNLDVDAEKAYQAALKIKPNHGPSLSNLAEIYFSAGKMDGAKQYWDSAIKANGKLVGARIGVASFELEEMRRVGIKDAKWKVLEDDARFQLSSALGANSESTAAYTVYGLVYMEGYEKNRNRLDLAKLLLDEAKKRDEKFAPLQNAYGLFYLHKNQQSEALQHFQAAVAADPKFVEAHMNVGLTTLGFRKYDTAKAEFSAVLALQPKNYDAVIGLGAASRGLKDLEGAEAQYKKAITIDGRRGEAYYNLAVLYKDFKATKQDPAASIATYNTAKDFFKQFLEKPSDDGDKQEAKEQIATIDKTVTQVQSYLKAVASQPQQPAQPAAPATPPATPTAPATTK